MATIKKPTGASRGDMTTLLGIAPPQFTIGMQLGQPGDPTQQLSFAQTQASQLPTLNSSTNTAGAVMRNKQEQDGNYNEGTSAGAMAAGSIAEKMKNATAKNAPGQTKKQLFG